MKLTPRRDSASLRRNLPSFLLRMMIYLIVVSPTSRMSYSDEQITAAKATSERYACGPRAAFALIRLLGEDATYSTVCNHVALSEKGCSIDDVRKALLAHDVQCAVRRLQFTDLFSTPLPLIVHITAKDPLDEGHFLIVTDVDKIGAHTYDPVTNQTMHWRWRSFSDWWRGYAIVPTQKTIWNGHSMLSYVLGIHLLVVVCVVSLLGRRVWPLLINPASMRSLFTVVIMLTFGLAHPEDTAAEEILRSNVSDGANAVALLGGIYGVEIPPGKAEGIDACDSLRKVQLRLQAYGVAASVRFLGYNDLASTNRPCIVPLRTAGKDKTTLCVFVQANSSDVHFVEAGPLTARTLSVDDFRRYWTGHAVFGNVAYATNKAVVTLAMLGVAVPSLLYTIFVRGRKLWEFRIFRGYPPKQGK